MFCECGCGRETNIIKNNCKSRELIKGLYRRFIHGHNPTQGRKYNGKWYKQCSKQKGIKEHRLLAEKVLGKPLSSKILIHHFDGKRFGRNIVICQDHSYHALLHRRQRAYEATGNPNKRKCHQCKKWDDPNIMIHRVYEYNGIIHEKYCHQTHRKLS